MAAHPPSWVAAYSTDDDEDEDEVEASLTYDDEDEEGDENEDEDAVRPRQSEVDCRSRISAFQRLGGRAAEGSSRSQFQPLGSSNEQVGIATWSTIPTHLLPDYYSGVGNPERDVLEIKSPGGLSDVGVTAHDLREWWRSWEPRVDRGHSPLHHDITRFCRDHELGPLELQHRAEALAFVKDAVHKTWPMGDVDVQVFGSSATGLALPCSDVDIALLSSSSCVEGLWQRQLTAQLKLHGVCQSFVSILHARVPLLKVKFRSGVACDISMNATNGPRGVPIIQSFMEQFDALRPLCLVLKYLLGLQELNQVFTGGLSSFSLICLVFAHLRKLGVVGCGNDLGALLVSFFMRYADVHNYSVDVVSLTSDAFVSKSMKGWVNSKAHDLLAVEDPLDPFNDLGKGSFRIDLIRALFSQARTALLQHWHEKDPLSHLMTMSRVEGEGRKRGKKQGKKQGKRWGRKLGKKCGKKRGQEFLGNPDYRLGLTSKTKKREEKRARKRAREADGSDVQQVGKRWKRKLYAAVTQHGPVSSYQLNQNFQNKWVRKPE